MDENKSQVNEQVSPVNEQRIQGDDGKQGELNMIHMTSNSEATRMLTFETPQPKGAPTQDEPLPSVIPAGAQVLPSTQVTVLKKSVNVEKKKSRGDSGSAAQNAIVISDSAGDSSVSPVCSRPAHNPAPPKRTKVVSDWEANVAQLQSPDGLVLAIISFIEVLHEINTHEGYQPPNWC